MVLSPLEDLMVTSGKSVKLECDVTLGRPKGDIRWFKDAKELYKGQKHR